MDVENIFLFDDELPLITQIITQDHVLLTPSLSDSRSNDIVDDFMISLLFCFALF